MSSSDAVDGSSAGTRQLFIRPRTTLINAIRAHLAEFGIVAGIGRHGVEALLAVIARGEEGALFH